MKAGVFLKAGLGCGVLLIVAVIALTILVVQRKHAYKTMADTHDLKQRVSDLAAKYTTKRTNAALVIGVIQRGKTQVFGFGHISATNSAAPNGDTIFEIGSVTKVFTAVALARMINDGTVKLEDPVARFLPSAVTVPQKDDREITLGHLATHTAGLPRLPDNMVSEAADKENPYASYHATNLYQGLSLAKIKSAPGTKLFYSNFGFGLLGYALSVKANTNYEALVREKVLEPLAMNDTVITMSDEQRSRLSIGHNPKGEVVPNWSFDVLAGCGAFRSTANDLLKFTAANLAEGTNTISRALTEARRVQFPEFAGGVGLAWQYREPAEGQHWYWHNGGTGGYVSFIGLDRNTQVSVVILSNYGDAMAGDNAIDLLGVEILRLLPKISLE